VVYVDMEMTEDDLEERLSEMGYGPDSVLDHLHYYLLAALPPLDSAIGGEVLMEIVARHGAALVVIDTMARVVRGEEDKADTYRAFYWHTGRRLKAVGVTLVRLDHMGKNPEGGQRGSSEKAGDIDVVFRLSVASEVVTLKRTHTRVPWVPEEVRLTRTEEPLRHVIDPRLWLGGTSETAKHLDELSVPLDASKRMALTALQGAGKGRRPAIVLDALKWRKEQHRRTQENGSRIIDAQVPPKSVPDPVGTTGNHYAEPPGNHREPLGEYRREPVVVSRREPLVPEPAPEPIETDEDPAF
jgi:hypothetical protein